MAETSHLAPGSRPRILGEAVQRPVVVPIGKSPDCSTALASGDWDRIRGALVEACLDTPLSKLNLPARLRNYATREGLITLGNLARMSKAEFLDSPGLAGGSLAALVREVRLLAQRYAPDGTLTDEAREHEVRAERAERDLAESGLLECFKVLVSRLDPVKRTLAIQRSGLEGDPLTLKEIGEGLGISGEWARQLQVLLCRELRLPGWQEVVERQLQRLFEAGAVPLRELADDPWWAAASVFPAATRFIFEELFRSPWRVIEFDGAPWLSRHSEARIEEVARGVLAQAQAVPLPAAWSEFERILDTLARALGPRLRGSLRARLVRMVQFDKGVAPQEALVLAVGPRRQDGIVAVLQAAKQPIHVDELNARFGRCAWIGDEFVRFGRNRLGLREHIEDFDGWRARLVPQMVSIIQQTATERQWSCAELLDKLRETNELPDWMTPFILAALVKAGDELVSLGRLRVALPGAIPGDTRVRGVEAAADILRAAGTPLPRDELLLRLRERISIADLTLSSLSKERPFVRVDAKRIGLFERDIPGGVEAAEAAANHLERLLERRKQGLSLYHAHGEIMELSPNHATWRAELLGSILRVDGRFRFGEGGGLGLAIWDSVRLPSRVEILRNALQEGGGRVPLGDLLDRILATYGPGHSRRTLTGTVSHLGARMKGKWVFAGAKPVGE